MCPFLLIVHHNNSTLLKSLIYKFKVGKIAKGKRKENGKLPSSSWCGIESKLHTKDDLQ